MNRISLDLDLGTTDFWIRADLEVLGRSRPASGPPPLSELLERVTVAKAVEASARLDRIDCEARLARIARSGPTG